MGTVAALGAAVLGIAWSPPSVARALLANPYAAGLLPCGFLIAASIAGVVSMRGAGGGRSRQQQQLQRSKKTAALALFVLAAVGLGAWGAAHVRQSDPHNNNEEPQIGRYSLTAAVGVTLLALVVVEPLPAAFALAGTAIIGLNRVDAWDWRPFCTLGTGCALVGYIVSADAWCEAEGEDVVWLFLPVKIAHALFYEGVLLPPPMVVVGSSGGGIRGVGVVS